MIADITREQKAVVICDVKMSTLRKFIICMYHRLVYAKSIVLHYICVAEGRDHCKPDLGIGL